MSQDADAITNTSSNAHIYDLIDPRRRSLLIGSIGSAVVPFVGGASLLAGCSTHQAAGSQTETMPLAAGAPRRPQALGFAAVSKSIADRLTVAGGYTASVLFRLGDPIAAGLSAYANNGTDTAASFAQRAGDHHDGMHYFGLSTSGIYSAAASDRGLLCINHEAITPAFLHPVGQTIVGGVRVSADEVLREFYAHGVSVLEVRRRGRAWSYVQDSAFNRRVHTLTETMLSGPARGAPCMVTKYSTDGTRTRGTLNNCAHGYTPWGSYLTCEEHWSGYFRRVAATDNVKRTAKELASFARYAVAGNGRELWATVTPDTADDLYGRWNAAVRGATPADDYRNVANTFGWNVEIDPLRPTSTLKKRTAMGRFAHEGAWPAQAITGKPVVFYMGCDARNEYVYKYVSTAAWDPADATRGMTAGDKYLDQGKLYAAKFNADGTGQWVELTFGIGNVTAENAAYAFADQADVVINARLAADAQGATKMDRPEWGAVDPVTGEVYVTLTNSNATLRTLASTEPANPRHYNDARTTGATAGTAQRGNPNGHIIRWKEPSPEALTFVWDIYLFGARAGTDPANINLSNLSADSDFSSPDGLWFSRATNICWIQTDDGAYTDVTNAMLLAALPGAVGDGAARTITNTDAAGASKQVRTIVGAAPGLNLRRFLVGPRDCEITGIAETPDGKTLFINVQHPGGRTAAANIGDPTLYNSHWPDGGAARPRSSTIVITKDDGGVIGL